ncbi:MAG: VIT domain-containing protein, partial [Anaerolineae bacterium]
MRSHTSVGNRSVFRSAAALLTVAVLALLTVQPALADGIIIPDPPPVVDPPPLRHTWLTIRYHRVRVSIEDQIAVTRVEQEFVNEHEWEAEGTYLFPLPEGASVSEFTMWVDGKPVEGKILEADEARRIYEDIVRRRRDPALLEYVGRDAVRARIFPIPPGGSRRIELTYTQVLPVENGLVDYVYPLSTEKYSARPLEECTIHVDVRSDDAMHAIYSPSHQDRLFVERDGDYHATVSYEETDVLPEQDFELVYTVSREDVGINLLTHPEAPREGFFLLLAAPTLEVAKERIVSRDVVLVLDTSGSMDGEKLSQAKEALTYVLQHLNEGDRFNVIAFSSGLSRYASGLRSASEARRATDWVGDLEAMGGTNINRALLEALALTEGRSAREARERPVVLIFLTDGLPTEGVTDIGQILANVESSAPDEVRLFPFGVGNDVNTVLLDSLAEQNRGATGYVRPGERIDEEVSALYAKIRTPVLTDLEIDFGKVMAEDLYPYPLPDLFAGSQLIAAGRYRLPLGYRGEGRIVLSGEVNG